METYAILDDSSEHSMCFTTDCTELKTEVYPQNHILVDCLPRCTSGSRSQSVIRELPNLQSLTKVLGTTVLSPLITWCNLSTHILCSHFRTGMDIVTYLLCQCTEHSLKSSLYPTWPTYWCPYNLEVVAHKEAPLKFGQDLSGHCRGPQASSRAKGTNSNVSLH